MYVGRVERSSVFKSSYFVEPFSIKFFQSAPPFDFAPAPASYTIEQNQIKRFSQHYFLDLPDDPYLRHAQEWLSSLISSGPMVHYNYPSAIGVALREAGDKSPGFFWKHLGLLTKRDVIEKCGDLLAQRVSEYSKHRAPWYLWSTALKDEMTSKKKIDARDTRLFFVGPIEHYIASIMQFGAVTEAVYLTAGQHPILVGLSKGRGHWVDVVFKRLGDVNYCVDASKYDTSLPAFLIFLAAEILIKLAPDPVVAFQLVVEGIFALVVDGSGNVFCKEGGNPSGGYLTLVLNCLAQTLLIVRANLFHCGCIPMKDLLLKIVGDDGVYTPLRCLLTPQQIIDRFGDYNVTLKEVQELPPSEVEFCGVSYEHDVLVPRVAKFYASMFYGKHKNPLYRAARLQSLWMELFEDALGLKTLDYVVLFSLMHRVPIRMKCLCELLILRYGAVSCNKLSALKFSYNECCSFCRSIYCPRCSACSSGTSESIFFTPASQSTPSRSCSSPPASASSETHSCGSRSCASCSDGHGRG